MMTYPVRRNNALALLEAAFNEGSRPATRWTPPVTVFENDEAFTVEAEVPGLNREQITVEVVRNELTVSGDKATEKSAEADDEGAAESKGAVRYTTRRSGSFRYRATLPGEVDAAGVTAALADGVLTVRVPKVVPAGARKVEIA